MWEMTHLLPPNDDLLVLRTHISSLSFVVRRLLENSDISDQLYDSMPHWWWWLTSFSFLPINLWIIYIYSGIEARAETCSWYRKKYLKKKKKEEKRTQHKKKRAWIDYFGFISIPFGWANVRKGRKRKKAVKTNQSIRVRCIYAVDGNWWWFETPTLRSYRVEGDEEQARVRARQYTRQAGERNQNRL